MSVNNKRIVLVIGAFTLFVLLYFAPKLIAKKADSNSIESISKTEITNASLDVFLNLSFNALGASQKKIYTHLLNEKKYDSLIVFWDNLKRPDLSSYFAEQKAKQINSYDTWFYAGKRYYSALQFTQDKSESPILLQCAFSSFNKALTINPKSTEAKILKASCIVEGIGNPMDGISLLKEVEKTDSNNVQLQLTFAFFSMRSKQLDKAIMRFNKVLKVDSNYIEAYLHLADIYEQLNQTKQTIDMLNQYLVRTTNETSKVEITKYIQQLKSSINK